MKPHIHSKNSVRNHGGLAADYQAIHDFIDSCTFRVTEFEMSLTSTPEDDSKSDYGIDGFEPTWTTKGGRTPAGEAVSELARIDDEVYLAVFGDHCRVTATRTGFEVEEYDHD